jgi:RIO-like serine/threonine protein kinase
LYLNGIPGITLKRASAIADENYLSGLELIRADEKEAVETVIRDLLMEISDTINTGLIHSSKDKKIVHHEDAEYLTPGVTGI